MSNLSPLVDVLLILVKEKKMLECGISNWKSTVFVYIGRFFFLNIIFKWTGLLPWLCQGLTPFVNLLLRFLSLSSAWWAPLTAEPPLWRAHLAEYTCTHDTDIENHLGAILYEVL